MKKLLEVTIFIFVLICSTSTEAKSQHSTKTKLPLAQEIPMVFLLGEHDKHYEEMMAGQATLLDVCDNDMNLAYGKLMGMMREMEAYSGLVGFELKGVNAWMHIFWLPDGSIDHIGFYLKPNSRNVDNDLMKNFLEGFAKQYKFPLKHGKKFSHYSSFSFPIVKHRTNPETLKSTAKVGTPSGVH